MIFVSQILSKFGINSLYICCPYTIGSLSWEIQKVIFQQYYSYILQIIYVISEEDKLLLPCPPHLKMSAHYVVKCIIFSSFPFFHAYRVPIRDMDKSQKRLVATWAEI